MSGRTVAAGVGVAVLALVVVATSACGGATGERRTGGQPAVSRQWDANIAAWKRELFHAASDDDVSFPTPSRTVFDRRLSAASSRFAFRVLHTEFVTAPQGSPLVIVETDSPSRFSEDVPEIVRLLDPRRDANDDWEGWDYEGFFLGAQDEDGVPFLSVFNFQRAHGGGQWARSEDLYPFDHG